jgi:hypothetical protein
MRIFIIADIHGNLPALEAVLADLDRFHPQFNRQDPGADRLICLGDVIGYYAHPNEVMDRVWDLTGDVLIGNHEISVHAFVHAQEHPDALTWGVHPHAAWAFKWTAENLNPRNRRRLEALIVRRKFIIEDYDLLALFAHAAPCMPELMDYITSAAEAYFQFFEPPECHLFEVAFVGHSHVPQFYQYERIPGALMPTVDGGIVMFREPGALSAAEAALPAEVRAMLLCERAETQHFEKTWHLPKHRRTLVSVPSVGQPRDGLPYSGYAVFDTDTRSVTMIRLPYNVAAAVAAMEKLPGCPETLITRLMVGR